MPRFAVGNTVTTGKQDNPRPELAKGSRGRVVVIDDDEGMREAIETLLEVSAFETAAFSSAEGALAGDALIGARCVVSDIKLPGMSGLDLLAILKTREPAPPVIIITAHDAPGIREHAMRRGAAAYFAKPFPGTALLDAIESVADPRAL